MVALGIRLQAEQGQLSQDDPRVEMTLADAHAAIADVMDYAANRDIEQVMDDLFDAVTFWVDRWAETLGIENEEARFDITAKLAPSLIAGAMVYMKNHSE